MYSVNNHDIGDADAQSVSTFGDARPTIFVSAAEISATLSAHVKGYSPESQASTSDRASIINTTKLLANLQPNSTEEDTGRCLYRNLTMLCKQVGPMFVLVTNNNFDLYQELQNICSKRALHNDTVSATEILTRVAPIAPDPTAFQFSLEVALARRTAELDAELSPANPSVKGSANKRANIISERVGAYALELKVGFNDKRTAYEDNFAAYQKAHASLLPLQRETKSFATLETFLQSLSSQQRMIVTRVTNALAGDPTATAVHLASIQLKLKGKATMHNGEVVDPLSSCHLPGIMHLLYDNYCVDTLHYYFDAVMNLFNYTMAIEEARSLPHVGFARLLAISNDWRMRGLYERLTHDLLFTCIAIKGVPPSEPLRAHLIGETTKYMRLLQSRSEPITGDTPVLDHVNRTIVNWIEDKRLQEHPGVAKPTTPAPAPATPSANNNTNPRSNRPYGNNNRGRFGSNNPTAVQPTSSTGLESAALAATPTAAPRTQPAPRVDCAGQRFQGEVAMSRNLAHNGVPYVAYKSRASICAQCFPDSGTASPCANSFHHYKGHCLRCNYFGHKLANCLHTHGADGKAIP